jgi:hypothetical protein
MRSPQPSSFLLSKSYLDVVTAEGAVVILYAARLRWGRLRAGYAAMLHDAPGGVRRERATIRRVERPRLHGDDLTWENTALGVRGMWRRAAPPIRRNLLRNATGAIQWACHMPLARATVRCGDAVLSGLGYVESLRLSIPPWSVPFHTLRWGHHASDDRSLVWIAWTGRESRRWIWLDGEEQPDADVTGDGIRGLSRGAALHIEAGRVVRDRRVLAAIGQVLPALGRRLAGPLARLREIKRLDRSTVSGAAATAEGGWSLHEVVTW